ncbi:7-deoxyloganetic acid glucosyltransferase-like [Abrus precatorius]|uniref:7-deoxyloganetic acid glucosyltransferase-like n=1 Tax=Abrus precatorius TaxID=3816 RepID=A0A8B8K1T4_ABRPR|nr:7-deoxyloganetic acid glucosyltransferase-like [Abrus precatorius]
MENSTEPHIVALPMQAEGHIKPMLNLTKFLSHRGHKITFVNSHYNHNRFTQHTHLPSLPNFHFASITDGLPVDHHPPNDFTTMITPTCRSLVAKDFREFFSKLLEKKSEWNPPSCIIADGMMTTIALDVAQEFQIPLITFRTYSATATWATIYICQIIQEGVMDLQRQEDVDKLLASIPVIENLLRDRDLPYIFKFNPGHFVLDFYVKETIAMTQASALILNTFDHLEANAITKLKTIFPKVYTIGPLHTLLKTHVTSNISSSLDGHLRKENRNCITWLDHQNEKSVLYISFGTVVKLSREQLMEFWHGLVNSFKPFLWVIRKDLINGGGGCLGDNVPVELELATKDRGLIVDWAPQEDVLSHPAVGGFLTHNGWNSTLECIVEGVPMLCSPVLNDQPINCRSVTEQWKIGLDMNGTYDRLNVEKMVRDLIENKIEGLRSSADAIAEMAANSVKETGSSYHNIENLMKDVASMKVRS